MTPKDEVPRQDVFCFRPATSHADIRFGARRFYSHSCALKSSSFLQSTLLLCCAYSDRRTQNADVIAQQCNSHTLARYLEHKHLKQQEHEQRVALAAALAQVWARKALRAARLLFLFFPPPEKNVLGGA